MAIFIGLCFAVSLGHALVVFVAPHFGRIEKAEILAKHEPGLRVNRGDGAEEHERHGQDDPLEKHQDHDGFALAFGHGREEHDRHERRGKDAGHGESHEPLENMRSILKNRRSAHLLRSHEHRQAAEDENQDGSRGPGIHALAQIPEIFYFLFPRNQFVVRKMPEHVGIMLNPPGPAPLLLVEADHALPKGPARSHIHGDRYVHRRHDIVAVVMHKALEEDARIIGHNILLPEADIHERLPAHAVGRKSEEPFRPSQLGQEPKGRGKGGHARDGIGGPDIIVVERYRLKGSAERIRMREISIG